MPDCTSCKEDRKSVPFIVHESDMARLELSIKRLWILLILSFVLLVGTNAVWIVYESQFEDVVTTITAEQTDQVSYDSGTAFSDAIQGKDMNQVLAVMDEAMTTIQALLPRLYNGIMQELTD